MSPLRSGLRIGVDVGGTNTDAVVVDRHDRLLAKAKVPTTEDVTGGIEAALAAVIAVPDIDVEQITHVMLGTTHATNAVLQRRGLRRVATIRVGAPAAESVRPLFGWPDDLCAAVSAGEAVVPGGVELDGRDIVPFDEDAVARFLGSVAGSAEAVAITSVFAPVSARHELAAEQVVRRELGGIPLSLSHEIGSLGLLERENATVLNAALGGVAQQVAEAIESALAARGLGAALTYFAQNDGTLMSLDYAIRHPVLTIGSGPANSLRGAAYLTGLSDALVADVGGTSTDVGALAMGYPRESALGVQVGGVRTNFRMPDLVSIALGGGTVVQEDGRVGPDSVGYRLERDALVFGGAVPTLTDAAVAGGRTSLGKPPPAGARDLLKIALAEADRMLGEAIDRIKVVRGAVPLVVVGGGSVLVPDDLPGVHEVLRPAHFDVANAIGAAIGAVSGQVDRIVELGFGGRDKVIGEAREAAKEQAVRAGADPGAVEVVDIEEIPLSYITNPAVRIRVKAAGPLGSA